MRDTQRQPHVVNLDEARHAPYGTWHAATVALSKAKLLSLDHRPSSGAFTSPFLSEAFAFASSEREIADPKEHGPAPAASGRFLDPYEPAATYA